MILHKKFITLALVGSGVVVKSNRTAGITGSQDQVDSAWLEKTDVDQPGSQRRKHCYSGNSTTVLNHLVNTLFLLAQRTFEITCSVSIRNERD